jgi:uncharacterized protein (DUF2147 family)
LCVVTGFVCCATARATQGPPPTGLWFTPDHGGVVQIRPCGDDLCGVIVGVTASPTGAMPRDVSGEPQCHLTLLRDLRLRDDGRWHGTVRNPEDGQVYDAEIWLPEDGMMRLRGYVGVSLLGETQSWQRFNGAVQPDCRFR